MPSATAGNVARLVLDESSLDFRCLADSEIQLHLDELSDAIQELRTDGETTVACPPMWDGVECLDGCQLYQFLSREHESSVDRDTLVRAFRLLSSCPEWTADEESDISVFINGEEVPTALSVGYALGRAVARHGVACLVFGASRRRGLLPVRGLIGEANIYFFAAAADLPMFWRFLFSFEDVREGDFFALGEVAFPNLVLHPGLSFNKFDGAYSDLRDRVVGILGALCDHFADEYARCRGLPYETQAAMGQYHVDLSPEAPKTRGSDRLMRLRRRDYQGVEFTCEWHAKLERHRNRIHFALPAPELEGKILIGIFDEHLET